MTHDEYLAIAGTAEIIWGAQTPEKHLLYSELFASRAVDDVKTAMRTWIQEGHKFPDPADLIARMPNTVTNGAAISASWRRVLQAACSQVYVEYTPGGGAYPTGEKLTPDELRLAGSIDGLCDIRDAAGKDDGGKQLDFLRKRFERRMMENVTFLGERENLTGGFQSRIGASDMKRLEAGSEPRRIGEAMEVNNG